MRFDKLKVANLKIAKDLWPGEIQHLQRCSLAALAGFGLSVAAGDLQLLNKHWYVT